MNIMPINCTDCPKGTNFRAKFSKADIEAFVEATQYYINAADRPAAIPKLYTMLKYFEELPGKFAKISQKNEATKKYGIIYEYGIIGEGYNAYQALKDAAVELSSNRNNSYVIKMPPRIFEMEWWANRHVKENDVLKLAYDA